MEKLVTSADLMGLRNHQKGRLGRIQLSMAKMLRSLQRGQKKHVSREPDNECGQVQDPPVQDPPVQVPPVQDPAVQVPPVQVPAVQDPPVTSPTRTRETLLHDSPNRLTRRYKCPIFCYSFICPIFCFIIYKLFFSNARQLSLLMEEETSPQELNLLGSVVCGIVIDNVYFLWN